MALHHGLGTYGNAVGTVTPLDHKLDQAGLVMTSNGNSVYAGVFWNGGTALVTGTANMSYNVAVFGAVLSRGVTAGAVFVNNDATMNVVTTAAPGANSRYDVVYIWQREYSLDGTDSEPVLGVLQGTAAASPSVPSLAAFPGAVALATILVPTGVTATNTGTTILQVHPWACAAGGRIPFRNLSDLTAMVSPNLYTRAFVYADSTSTNNGEYLWNGAGWVPTMLPALAIPSSVTVSGGSATVSASGVITLTAVTSATINGVFLAGIPYNQVAWDLTLSSSAYGQFQFTTGGSVTAGTYSRQLTGMSATTVSTNQVASDTFSYLSPSTNTGFVARSDFFNVANSSRVKGVMTFMGRPDGSGIITTNTSFTTACDGLKVFASAGTITGTIRIYAMP